ncbi:HD domain-containing protein [Lutibacter sp.]|uniref:HD domain-containing protein n=1 Tax=Lutibacter sp. TaxID=1925666 RepID=UPI0025B97111|nr:HD domain-containing protein [Lutibacter sp.]
MIQKAIRLAKDAHSGQVRKYTNEPYIIHPFSVAGLVASVSSDEEMYSAAILHDTVEDTDVDIKTIENLFGIRVSGMVDDLTDVSVKSDGCRKVRKKLDRDHTEQSSNESKTIKLADLIDNTRMISLCDPGFAKVYMAEKILMLDILKGGNVYLYNLASNIVRGYYENETIV